MWARNSRRSVYEDSSGQRRHKPDYILLILTMILLVVGLIVVYSISPGLAAQRNVSDNYFASKQLIVVVLGIFTFLVASKIPLEIWKKLQYPFIIFAFIVTVIALASPVSELYPAHRWVRFAGFSLQSVEVIKLALIMSLATFLSSKIKNNTIKNEAVLKPILMILGVFGVVVALLQSDLGSAGVLVVITAAMAFIAGLPLKRIILISGLILIGVTLSIGSSAYRRQRVETFLNPEADCQNSGYQACQALIAVGSGGISGKGLSSGAQAYGYLPEAGNDSIFAIFAEKFGFIGVVILISLFMGLFTRLVRILERAPDDYSRLVVAGVLAWLSTQTLINMGAMIGLIPLKGITLPFISSGGTSLIFMLFALGQVFNISRFTTYGIQSTDRQAQSPINSALNFNVRRQPTIRRG